MKDQVLAWCIVGYSIMQCALLYTAYISQILTLCMPSPQKKMHLIKSNLWDSILKEPVKWHLPCPQLCCYLRLHNRLFTFHSDQNGSLIWALYQLTLKICIHQWLHLKLKAQAVYWEKIARYHTQWRIHIYAVTIRGKSGSHDICTCTVS